MSRYRTNASTNWGYLFGLSPADLTDDQLQKIDFEKIIELMPVDARAERAAGDKLLTATVDELRKLDRLEELEFKNAPYFLSKYNSCVSIRGDSLDDSAQKDYYNRSRESYVFWKMLNIDNKCKEFERWMDNKKHVIDEELIDYYWLDTHLPSLVVPIIEKMLTAYGKKSCSRYSSLPIVKMVSQLPQKYMEKYVRRIFECDSSIYIHALSNKYTPDQYVIRALKEIAGKKKIPKLNVTLNKYVLQSLASVTRLNLLESLLIYMHNGSVKFSDINSEEELKPLLFGTAIKYNSRVEHVIRYYKKHLLR